jgi:cytochrome d ubiquinol oxidase subunit I
MDMTALLLSRLQFAFTITFHIIFPSFTIGLAAWLTVLEALRLATGLSRALRLRAEKIWRGIRTGRRIRDRDGIPVRHELDVLSKMSGPIQGPLLMYETFTAFMLEASFFGVLIFGRSRVPPWFYLFSTRWWRWGPRFRRSGSWSITAGCRCPQAMSWKMAPSFQTTGPRSSSTRWCGRDFRANRT